VVDINFEVLKGGGIFEEVIFEGTVSVIEFSCEWSVHMDKVVDGKHHGCSDIYVYAIDYWYTDHSCYGYIDPSIQDGDRVQVYGRWVSGDENEFYCSVTLGCEQRYYIKKIGSGEPLHVNLWIDKGCGATYEVGETMIIYFEINKDCYISLEETSNDEQYVFESYFSGDTETILSYEYYSAGTHSIYRTVEEPTGEHTLTIYADTQMVVCSEVPSHNMDSDLSSGHDAEDMCNFHVEGGSEPLNIDLWIDKGCGSTYKVGDSITISFESNKDCYVTLEETTSYGTETIINYEYYPEGTHSIHRTVKDPTGEHILKIYADIYSGKLIYEIEVSSLTMHSELSSGYDAEDTCSFYVEKRDPCEGVNCDQYDGYVGDYYCKNGDLYRKYRDYYCEDGKCKYIEEERKIEDCEYGCENGGCIVDPCAHDSDNDSVPDCKDQCDNTPPEYYVNEKGCKVCLKHNVACDVKLASFLPYIDKLPQSIILINDWCRVKEALELDMPWFEKVDRIAAFLQDLILMPAHIIAAKISLEAEIVTYLLQVVVYIQDDCGNPFVDEIKVGKEFFEKIYESVSHKLAEENIDSMTVFVGSPVKLIIKDEGGNILSENNKMGIPTGFFYEYDDYKMALIINPKGEYKIETIGTDEGTYDLKIKTITNGKITKSKEFDDVQTSQGKVDIYSVNISPSGKVDIGKSGNNDIKESIVLLFVGFILSIGFVLFLIGIHYKGF